MIDGSGLEPKSRQKEILKIHEENLAKLSSMSEEEILRHQQQLQAMLLSKFCFHNFLLYLNLPSIIQISNAKISFNLN